MITYKDDDSFFTTVFPPFVHHGFFIKNWLLRSAASKFRYIRDTELENGFYNVSQIHEIYPGVKTIGLILNPWNRMAYSYKMLCDMKKARTNNYGLNVGLLELDTFDTFINSLQDMAATDTFWFTLATPQVKWFSVGNVEVDYILRAEHITEDMQGLRDYFLSDLPLEDPNTPGLASLELPSYKEFYNDETKRIVAEVFKEDIEGYNYSF